MFYILEFASTKQPMLAFSRYAQFKTAKLWLSEDLTRWEQSQRVAISNVMEKYWQVDHVPFRHFTRA